MEYQPDRLKWQIGSGLLLIGVVSVLVACGGGGSKEATATPDSAQSKALAASTSASVPAGWKPRVPGPEVINGITVPPEPAPNVNNATLAGVDSNTNGVRDDVERILAKKARDRSDYDNSFKVAAAYQLAIVGLIKSQADADRYMLTIACAAEKTAPTLTTRDIQALSLSNSARVTSFRSNTTKFSGREIDPDIDCR